MKCFRMLKLWCKCENYDHYYLKFVTCPVYCYIGIVYGRMLDGHF